MLLGKKVAIFDWECGRNSTPSEGQKMPCGAHLKCLTEVLQSFVGKYENEKHYLSYDVASGSEITPCNKIDKPLVVYRFTGNVMTSITTLRT